MFSDFFKSTYNADLPDISNSQSPFTHAPNSHTPNSLTYNSQTSNALTSNSRLPNSHLSNSTDSLELLGLSQGEVEHALRRVDTNKGGGPDGIPNLFVAMLSNQLFIPLTTIFNRSLSLGQFPRQFGRANTHITNYRPISFLNSSAKVFEKLMHDKILSFLSYDFDANQHGFLNQHSQTHRSLSTKSQRIWIWGLKHMQVTRILRKPTTWSTL